MRSIEKIEPLTFDFHSGLLAKISDPHEDKKTWFFLVDEDLIILGHETYMENWNEWGSYQIEFPKKGLPWFVKILEEKFFKIEAEGGLPKGQFYYKETVAGERLKLARAFGVNGYAFITLDRINRGLAKNYTLSDDFLFNYGMFNLMKELAKKIEAGEI